MTTVITLHKKKKTILYFILNRINKSLFVLQIPCDTYLHNAYRTRIDPTENRRENANLTSLKENIHCSRSVKSITFRTFPL